jgi:DNA-binding PadR family transcriptional regulator
MRQIKVIDSFRYIVITMSVTIYPDRDIGVMEIFILALVNRGGLNSIYALQKRAALQPGGIRPALTRLEAAGLLERSDHGSRRRRELIATGAGSQFLSEHWYRALQGHIDLESVLRATAVALLMGDVDTARQYLRDISVERERSAKQRELEAESYGDRSDPLSNYMWMRALCESHRRRAEGVALQSVRQQLKEERHVHQQ